MRIVEQAIQQFRSHFGHEPACSAYAPGRVTVIGGHTDYNGGLVVSAALPCGTAVCARENQHQKIRIISNRQPQPVELGVLELPLSPDAIWARYVVGVLLELNCAKQGMDISIYSNVPMRRGLASSAALTVSTALATMKLINQNMQPLDLVRLCQQVEEKHVGVRCGLLDPYTALHGTSGQLLQIDCADISHEAMTLPRGLALVVCDSGVDRQLAKSQYNLRRQECQQVANALDRSNLRDVTIDELKHVRAKLPVPTRRAEHVVREIGRVAEFWQALSGRDYSSIKSLMFASHASCRDLFECSHSSLDKLVERAMIFRGCVGARLTGAGWGGATVNIVYRKRLNEFCESMSDVSTSIRY